ERFELKRIINILKVQCDQLVTLQETIDQSCIFFKLKSKDFLAFVENAQWEAIEIGIFKADAFSKTDREKFDHEILHPLQKAKESFFKTYKLCYDNFNNKERYNLYKDQLNKTRVTIEALTDDVIEILSYAEREYVKHPKFIKQELKRYGELTLKCLGSLLSMVKRLPENVEANNLYDRRSTFGGFFSGTRCAGYLEKYWKDEFIEENDKKRIDDFVSRLNTQEGFFHYYLQLWSGYLLVLSESDDDKQWFNLFMFRQKEETKLLQRKEEIAAMTQEQRLTF